MSKIPVSDRWTEHKVDFKVGVTGQQRMEKAVKRDFDVVQSLLPFLGHLQLDLLLRRRLRFAFLSQVVPSFRGLALRAGRRGRRVGLWTLVQLLVAVGIGAAQAVRRRRKLVLVLAEEWALGRALGLDLGLFPLSLFLLAFEDVFGLIVARDVAPLWFLLLLLFLRLSLGAPLGDRRLVLGLGLLLVLFLFLFLLILLILS